MPEDVRAKYWNGEYFDYWKKRVEEANRNTGGDGSAVVKDDFKIPSDRLYETLMEECVKGPGRLLDVGCGWGRMFGLYASLGMRIYGTDISSKMVEEARKCGIPQVVEVAQGTAETIFHEEGFFDYVTCFGVFDATRQEQALGQFIRVLGMNGRLFLTGKNDRYFEDDEEASLAEAGARRKGEPNHFTNVKEMIGQLNDNGHKVVKAMYFERRGDFGKGKYLERIPDRFYEYCLVVEKGSGNHRFNAFSSESSIASDPGGGNQ